MSVFIVSDDHIDLLTTVAVTNQPNDLSGNPVDPQKVGEMLLELNVRSWNERYGESETTDGYQYQPVDLTDFNAKDILNAVNCYLYQIDCADGYKNTAAYILAKCLEAETEHQLAAGPQHKRLDGTTVSLLPVNVSWEFHRPNPGQTIKERNLY